MLCKRAAARLPVLGERVCYCAAVRTDISDTATDADADFREKIRSINFGHRPVGQKKTVDHTDTAIVTTTTKDETQDVHVAMRDAVRPHHPEMTRKYWKEQQDA